MTFIRIDEKTNIIDSFEKARDFIINQKDELDLKWFIISLHHAVHSLMLHALVNTAGEGIWKENPRKGLPVRRPDGLVDTMNKRNMLLNFMEAFYYIQNPKRMRQYVISKHFKAEPYHRDSMQCLNHRLRNEFIHYKPIGWSISKEYIYKICKPVLEVAEFLIFESNQCNFNEEEDRYLRTMINDIKEHLVSELNNNDPITDWAEISKNKYLIISVIGPHAGETEDQIFDRKRDEIIDAGKSFWLIKSHKAKVNDIQKISRQALAEQYDIYCVFIEPAQRGGSVPTIHDSAAQKYSKDNIRWEKIPKGIKVTGKIDSNSTAMVFSQIDLMVKFNEIDLWQYSDFSDNSPIKTIQGASTVCSVKRFNQGMKSRFRKIIAVARLTDPFAVYLK